MPDDVKKGDENKGEYQSPFEIVEEPAPGEGSSEEPAKSTKPEDKTEKSTPDYSDDERLSASQREDDEDLDDPKGDAGKDGETPEQIEARRSRRRAERQAQKRRQQAARERDAREMNFLRTRNEQLERKYGSLEERVTQNEVMQVEGRLEQLRAAQAEAEEVLARAIEANNGSDVVKLNRTIRQLEEGIKRLNTYKAELEKEKPAKADKGEEQETTQARTTPSAPTPRVVKNLSIFAERHPWFDPTKGDEDSRIVLALDDAVKADGFDPETKAYWVELEDRMARRLPERMKIYQANGSSGHRDDDKDDDEDTPAPQRRNGSSTNGAAKPKAGGPRMSSGSQTRGTGKQFILSAARKQAMVEAGVWDDPELRDKYIGAYAQYDKEHPEATK